MDNIDHPNHLADEDQAAKAVSDSAQRPAVIYKHSDTCGMCDLAIIEFERFRLGEMGRLGGSRFDFHQVDVIGARPASQLLERMLGVRHESPQVLFVWESRCFWHGSHRAIKEDRLIAEAEAFFKSQAA